MPETFANGQIQLHSEFGSFLTEIVQDVRYKTILEVGTWKGNGTTRCIVEGLIKRFQRNPIPDFHFYSLEANYQFYLEALALWLPEGLPFLQLIYGKLHLNGLLTREQVQSHTKYDWVKTHFQLWFEKDVEDYKRSPFIHPRLLPELDIVVLDGGEFCGYADWQAIKQRNPKIVCLDDIIVMKNCDVLAELECDNAWEKIAGSDERHGWAVFKHKE